MYYKQNQTYHEVLFIMIPMNRLPQLELLRSYASPVQLYKSAQSRYISGRNPEGQEHLGQLDIDGSIILKYILEETGCDHMDCILLTPNSNYSQIL
jgi:hypothetical protein